MNTEINKILKWYQGIGNMYIENSLSIIDIKKLTKDKDYANKMFFFYWGFERQGAPAGYKIAAIKTLSSVGNDFKQNFLKYYKGNTNKRNNPILDTQIENLNIPSIIKKIKDESFSEAFSDLKLKGIGHKIRAFFIRDIVYLLNIEKKSKLNLPEYLFMNPIDIWVKLTVEGLDLEFPKNQGIKEIKKNKYGLSKENFEIAVKLTNSCMEANVSPLIVNMGMWYYASQFIGDNGRLKEILGERNIDILEYEMNLMFGFRNLKKILKD